jgi:hypothetical protein
MIWNSESFVGNLIIEPVRIYLIHPQLANSVLTYLHRGSRARLNLFKKILCTILSLNSASNFLQLLSKFSKSLKLL